MERLLPDQVEGGLPRNFIRPCILLLLAERASHGYDLLERLGSLAVHETDPGRLYRVLRAIEREGLVRSHWDTGGSGPARRTYELTDDGLEWLHAWAGALAESERIVGGYLERYERTVGDRVPGTHAP